LDEVMPYFLRKMSGEKAAPNSLLVRAVLGRACCSHFFVLVFTVALHKGFDSTSMG